MKPFLIAAALAAVVALPATAQNLAIVNGKPVPLSRMAVLAQQAERSGRPVDDAVKAQLREELIIREVFAQEADRRGLKASPAYRQQMELAAQTILIRELFTDFQKKNPVTDADIRAEYDKIVAVNTGKEYRARHILVESEAEAKDVIAQLGKGAKFEDLAKKLSKDPGSGANGGDLDWANPNNFVPEFGQAMTQLAKGQVSAAPVKSDFGWHVIRVDDTRDATLPALDELKQQIAQQLEQQKLVQFQQKLRSKAKVE